MKKSKGIAYVDFDTPEAAKSAIEQVRKEISELKRWIKVGVGKVVQ